MREEKRSSLRSQGSGEGQHRSPVAPFLTLRHRSRGGEMGKNGCLGDYTFLLSHTPSFLPRSLALPPPPPPAVLSPLSVNIEWPRCNSLYGAPAMQRNSPCFKVQRYLWGASGTSCIIKQTRTFTSPLQWIKWPLIGIALFKILIRLDGVTGTGLCEGRFSFRQNAFVWRCNCRLCAFWQSKLSHQITELFSQHPGCLATFITLDLGPPPPLYVCV